MGISVLSDSIEVLRVSEATIAKERYSARKRRHLLSLVMSFETVRIGMAGFISPAAKFLAYWGAGLIILAASAQVISISPENLAAWRLAAGIFAFIFVAFAVPSSYVADGICDAHVKEVVSRLSTEMGPSETEVGALESTIGEFHERALARVNAFQWTMAASWALATYLYSQLAGVALKILPAAGVVQQLANAGMQLVTFAFVSLLMLWAVFGYKRSVDKTFKLSRLALRQLRLELAPTKQGIEIRQTRHEVPNSHNKVQEEPLCSIGNTR